MDSIAWIRDVNTMTTASHGVVPSSAIKKQLRLRFNTLADCHEVYTTMIGSGGDFKWFACTKEIAAWYTEHFGLKIESYLQPSLRSGGIVDVDVRKGTPRDVYDK